MSRTHHFIHFKRINLLYGRVPKVANSSIKHALCKLLEEKPTKGLKTTSDRFWRDYSHDETELLSPLQARKLRNTHFSFSFVRNPFDRLVAAYNNKVIEIEAPPLPMQRMGVKHGMTFDEFINTLLDNPLENFDVHILPQFKILCTENHLVPKFIGRMEEMDHHWANLRKRMLKQGIKVAKTPPQKNVRRLERNSLRKYFHSSEVVDKTIKLYGKDIEIFYPDASIDDLIENKPLETIHPKKISKLHNQANNDNAVDEP